MTAIVRAYLFSACFVVVGGCNFEILEPCKSASAGDALSCATPGEVDRAFDLEVPAGWDGASPLPLIYMFHGGGGHRSSVEALTCPDGETGDPACFSHKARPAGYAIVRPDGTGHRPLRNIRTWNAGGGGDWVCVSGGGCAANVDDMAYLDKVHAEIVAILPIDTDRVFATGISNGGAISHRLACERSDRIAAIVAVGGANQFEAAGGTCAAGVAMLQIHGTEDPIWIYETSREGGVVDDNKLKVGAEESTEAWATRNGCGNEREIEALPDTADDATHSDRLRWQGCNQATELIRIEGGGHSWPQGNPYLSEDRIGRVSQDFDADDIILEFFGDNAR